LGWLSYPVAQAIWSGATLLCYAAALWGRQARSQTALLALLAPATAMNLLYGQNGFLTAALLVGGIRLAPSRPVLGGVLLGLLSYKPQFGLLVPIALAAAALWRVALVAAFTVAIVAAASLLAFGVEPWIAWIQAMPEFGEIVSSERAHLLHLMPTALSDALALGASDRLATIIQGAVTIAAAAGVWYAFRRGLRRSAAAVLALASVLASPYAFIYDLTLVGAAIALIATERNTVLSAVEVLVLAVAMLLPVGMFLNAIPPMATVVHGAVFGMILLRLSRLAPVPASERLGSAGR
jgi:alpha-1,2-mannosyltransferase